MRVGDIYVMQQVGEAQEDMPLCKVLHLYHKPVWPDPECTESIEIRYFVRFVHLSGKEQGAERSLRKSTFVRVWEKVPEKE